THYSAALAVVSLAIQVVETCKKLYCFWESVRGAPDDVVAIMEDLKCLSTVVEDISRDKLDISTSVAVGLKCCQSKMRAALQNRAALRIRRRDSLVGVKEQSSLISLNSPATRERSVLMSNDVIKKILKNSVDEAIEQLIDSGTVQELMSRAVSHVTTFESVSSGECDPDGYVKTTPQSSQSLGRGSSWCGNDNFPNTFTSSHSRVCHQVSSYGFVFGCVWVRTSIVHLEVPPSASKGSFQTVTSFIFYPALWLKRVGVQHGVEASMMNSQDGWQFHLNSVRAVPEDSEIFKLCQYGEVGLVEHLIADGLASVLDTSPKGWTPLHFAAAGGHVKLCASLIRFGADKSALAYEGPASNTKIRMLRLFSDCLDISEPNGNGWTVHAALKRSYNSEDVPVSQNSITWLLRTTSTEKFVVCGPRTIWSGVQHAVRSFLVHERSHQVLHRLLGLSDDSNADISTSHATAFAHWLALRSSERELLPMMLKVGGFCQVQGFDWFEDDIKPKDFVKALPAIYAAWAVAFPNSMDKVEELIQLELEICFKKLRRTPKSFLNILSSNTSRERNVSELEDGIRPLTCSTCHDSYGQEGYGLVQPARIKFAECVRTNHSLNCNCSNILHDCGPIDLHSIIYDSQTSFYYSGSQIDSMLSL
ncbi:hypothetical protein GQ44DRAFT_633681, partial [Phaeosphaeriaceae sp. PMI808]